MEDFLRFKKMITPLIIQFLFWIGVVLSVIIGLLTILGGLIGIVSGRSGGFGMVFVGLMWTLIGPIAARIYCELLIVIFSINDTLTEIKNLLKDKNSV